ncbi:NAD(P)-dependent oxidoreductase [Streptomyces iranensis]|uniref:3-hydroxyisobutyrate dehydrogenase-like beta-hydroxyacid dehydrogenase n=1 Tax=Streptomyces iranensis TaxID=576784 RepID=A0A060ZFF5_9ACTN|nr:NAD(P)-dependent oxidoreductase [Streptomyces iranensis]MBP2062728.1 3-hydroxyisobutyrate dehydrogenase-like beta-hydroxyacid dehydrogenase [Streptomyces iranensis]CDR04610.1 6-phosphogluconate dehydrogenase NAD-bindingprotein [Streptomyces iranensis]
MSHGDQPAEARPHAVSVGFVGLGNIGLPMARALTGAGHALRVHDLDPQRMQAAEDTGMTAATGGVKDLAGCAVVALAVSDDAATCQILTGDSGLLASLAPGSLVLLHSTLLPATVHRIGQEAQAHGVELVEAPVSGGAERALRGELTVMAGGSEAALTLARPYLEAIATETVHIGPLGAGAVAKLANQLMMFSALAGAYEALDLAKAYGVDAEAVLRAVGSSTGDSWVTREWGFFEDVAAAYDRGGVPRHQRSWSKDLWDVLSIARDVQLPVPYAALLAQTLAQRIERRSAEQN